MLQLAAAPLLTSPVAVLTVLLAVLAIVFAIDRHPQLGRIYKFVPLLLFCYFVPTALSNTGVIPLESELYTFVKDWLLPASLVLLILAVDVPAILDLGRNAVVLFLVAAATIMIGGPLAYLLLGWWVSPEAHEQAWRGLAALSGSWIGGGANFTAIKESVGASDEILGTIIVIDVAVANVWLAVLLFFAGKNRDMDRAIGADTTSVDRVRTKAAEYQASVARPTDLPALLAISALGIGGAFLAAQIGGGLNESVNELLAPPPEGEADALTLSAVLRDISSPFTWTILLVTAFGLVLSFTPLRRLEGAGASRVGAVFLYLLVATIGAKAEFKGIFDPENLPLVTIGALWMLFHATAMLITRYLLRAPIFFAAIGSKSCVGGAASAPVVAAAFDPALAPVGALLAIGGYVLGTIGGLACAAMLRAVDGFYFG